MVFTWGSISRRFSAFRLLKLNTYPELVGANAPIGRFRGPPIERNNGYLFCSRWESAHLWKLSISGGFYPMGTRMTFQIISKRARPYGNLPDIRHWSILYAYKGYCFFKYPPVY